MKFGVLIALLSFCAGCAHVPTYERGKLMSPAMVGSADSLEQGIVMHMNQTREAMLGAAGGGGASCGCN